MNSKLVDTYYIDYLKMNPPISHLKEKQPNIYSDEFTEAMKTLRETYIRKLKNKKKVTLQEKILLNDLQYENKSHSQHRGLAPGFPITLYSNIIIQYWEESNMNYSEKEKSLFIKKSESLYEITSSIILEFTKGISAGETIHKMIVNKMIDNYDTILKKKLTEIQIHIITNLQILQDFMKHTYINHAGSLLGLHAISGGETEYRKLVKKNTFSIYTPEKIYKYGKQELKRLMKIKKKLQTMLGVDNIDDYVRKHKKISRNSISDMEKIKEKLYESYTSFFNSKTIQKKELYSVEKIPKEEVYNGVYYKYQDKKGVVYIDNKMEISKQEMIVLSLHEGIPGHHLQLYLDGNKKVSNYSMSKKYNGFVEGWAFYCESLYHYDDIIEYYFKLQYDIFRTVRLVVDVGIHMYRWSFKKSFTYMKKYSAIFSDKNLQDEILRYSSIPGQALSYKICGCFFKNLQDFFVGKHNMDIKKFHEIVLRNSPGPINVIGSVIISELREAL